MESFRVKGKETRKLHQLYKKLEQDWHAFKESTTKPTRRTRTGSRKYHDPNASTNIKLLPIILQQRDISPRQLMYELQREPSSPPPAELAWRNNNDVAAREILQERREAIESGKLKGRRLFHESTVEEGESEEVRSISFHYSEEDEHDIDQINESCGSKGLLDGYSYSSSFNSSSSAFNMDRVVAARVADIRVANARTSVSRPRCGIYTRYAVLLGGFAVALLVVAIAMCMSFDYDVILVPT